MDKNYKKDLNRDILFCNGCFKKTNNHIECYKKFCSICQTFYNSKELLEEHATFYHIDNWCSLCNNTIKNLQIHKSKYHT